MAQLINKAGSKPRDLENSIGLSPENQLFREGSAPGGPRNKKKTNNINNTKIHLFVIQKKFILITINDNNHHNTNNTNAIQKSLSSCNCAGRDQYWCVLGTAKALMRSSVALSVLSVSAGMRTRHGGAGRGPATTEKPPRAAAAAPGRSVWPLGANARRLATAAQAISACAGDVSVAPCPR